MTLSDIYNGWTLHNHEMLCLIQNNRFFTHILLIIIWSRYSQLTVLPEQNLWPIIYAKMTILYQVEVLCHSLYDCFENNTLNQIIFYSCYHWSGMHTIPLLWNLWALLTQKPFEITHNTLISFWKYTCSHSD